MATQGETFKLTRYQEVNPSNIDRASTGGSIGG